MRRQLALLTLLAAGAAAAAPAGSAEGRIPVWMPTVIAQPGHYILTRDVMAAAGPAVSIMADGVTLDLNGHTIGSTDMTQPVIQIGGTSGAEKGIVIANGKVKGGWHSISGALPPDDSKPLFLTDLTIAGSMGAGVQLTGFSKLVAQGIIIVNTKVGFDLQATAPGYPPDPIVPTATIRRTEIRGGGGIHCTGVICSIHDLNFEYDPPSAAPPTPAILLEGATGGEAVGIIIVNSLPAGGIQPCVLDLIGVCWITLSHVKVIGPASGIAPCVHVDPTSRDIVIRDSVLTRCGGDGIRLEGTNGIVKGNLITGAGANGIFAGGTNFIIDDGKLSDNVGAGIWFETPGHVYRNNILRGNRGRGTDGPGLAGSTDAGGNVE